MAIDATLEKPADNEAIEPDLLPSGTNRNTNKNSLAAYLGPLASLKLTVTLFSLSIILVFVGTLAQTHMNLATVLSQYFRCWWAWFEIEALFPPAWFGDYSHLEGWGVWFPGGWTIGTLMTLNLLAAHSIRFKSRAKGTDLIVGSTLTVIGIILTWIVITSGSGQRGVIETSKILDWDTLWVLLKLSLVLFSAICLYGAFNSKSQGKIEFRLMTTLAVISGVTGIWLFGAGSSAQINDSGMRILWQLIQGTVASLVLLSGCYFLFKKRAGIVLLHAGVLLIMSNEAIVAYYHVESRISLKEGAATNYTYSLEHLELAIVDNSNPDEVKEVVVPMRMLKDPKSGNKIQNEKLPFDIQPKEFYANSTLRIPKDDEEPAATHGNGTDYLIEAAPKVSGIGTDEIDLPAVIFEVFPKGKSESIGVYSCPFEFGFQDKYESIKVGEKSFDVNLRFKRYYKDYTVKLYDVRKDDYIGTNTPRNYSSQVHIVDPTRNEDREYKIWMNNPLRFAGETFYQSGYDKNTRTGEETTILQVVSNTGWMIPYVGCMVVATGMLANFLLVLIRFLNRLNDGRIVTKSKLKNSPLSNAIVIGVVVLFGGYLLSKASPPKASESEMNLYAFGQIPVVYEGRVKPLDTLARNTMRIFAKRETYFNSSDEKQSAIRWFADVIAGPEFSMDSRVFKIDNDELERELGLERRKNHLYSIKEFQSKIQKLAEDAAKAAKLNSEKKPLTPVQRHKLNLANNLSRLESLMRAFHPPDIRSGGENIQQDVMRAMQRVQQVEQSDAPLLIPPSENDTTEDEEENADKWTAFSVSWFRNLIGDLLSRDAAEEKFQANEFTTSFSKIIAAYVEDDVSGFNSEVRNYKSLLNKNSPDSYDKAKINSESSFNNFSPLFYTGWFYLIPFLLTIFGWLFSNRTLNRSAFWLTIFLFAVHTYALVLRIYISGRPPVTNLYSSAIFIGWAGVLGSIIMERMFHKGIGNALAAISGFATLQIAHQLAGDGETIVVLQAVLDTQFWLATHVVCITLGYAATFLAGFLGIIYILGELFVPNADREIGKNLTRMTYGIVCFGLFYSFVGTVLGGLWADDSWGRFWGWDPKENGALLIVLWNALVLHARWDKLVGDRGMAALVIGGNIVTAWSWFGVNELGVGLHAYGFTDGVLNNLKIFAIIQLAIIGLAFIPRSNGWTGKQKQEVVVDAFPENDANSDNEFDYLP